MTEKDIIQELKQIAPKIIQITLSYDMGYEFSAIVPDGVIFAYPGMLLDFSEGKWPPDEWKQLSDEEFTSSMDKLLLGQNFNVTPWEEISSEELQEIFDAVQKM